MKRWLIFLPYKKIGQAIEGQIGPLFWFIGKYYKSVKWRREDDTSKILYVKVTTRRNEKDE